MAAGTATNATLDEEVIDALYDLMDKKEWSKSFTINRVLRKALIELKIYG